MIVAVDGKRLTGDSFREQTDQISAAIGAHKGTEVKITVRRDGREQVVTGRTRLDSKQNPPRYRFGFGYDPEPSLQPAGPIRASGLAVERDVDRHLEHRQPHRADLRAREARTARQRRRRLRDDPQRDPGRRAARPSSCSALISLSLGVINLFPFLPLDGGHIFWALAEKVRGKAIPFSVMERAGFVGFALVIALFLVGLSNDLDRLANGGFRLR